MNAPLRGQCFCGAVRFEVDGDLPRMYQCHCSRCRKQSGSASNTSLLIKAADFRWLSGEADIRSHREPSGYRSDFCAHCGVPVPNRLSDTDFVWVPAGLLPDDPRLRVGAHIFVASRASWDDAPLLGYQHDTMPSLAELIVILHAETR